MGRYYLCSVAQQQNRRNQARADNHTNYIPFKKKYDPDTRTCTVIMLVNDPPGINALLVAKTSIIQSSIRPLFKTICEKHSGHIINAPGR